MFSKRNDSKLGYVMILIFLLWMALYSVVFMTYISGTPLAHTLIPINFMFGMAYIIDCLRSTGDKPDEWLFIGLLLFGLPFAISFAIARRYNLRRSASA